ncbi:hypothetical protein MMC10_011279 [Thelotrema lepadinum]|nr:hypothetical protein [Thelotrema lepadinum]
MTRRKPNSNFSNWTLAEERLLAALRLQVPTPPWEAVHTIFNQRSLGPHRTFWAVKNKFQKLQKEQPALIEKILHTASQELSNTQTYTSQYSQQQVTETDPSTLQAGTGFAQNLSGGLDARYYFVPLVGRDMTPAEMRQLAISAATGEFASLLRSNTWPPNRAAYY